MKKSVAVIVLIIALVTFSATISLGLHKLLT